MSSDRPSIRPGENETRECASHKYTTPLSQQNNVVQLPPTQQNEKTVLIQCFVFKRRDGLAVGTSKTINCHEPSDRLRWLVIFVYSDEQDLDTICQTPRICQCATYNTSAKHNPIDVVFELTRSSLVLRLKYCAIAYHNASIIKKTRRHAFQSNLFYCIILSCHGSSGQIRHKLPDLFVFSRT